MEMYPLTASPHSFKDLAIHIGIVTVGILIALSLEGIRETIHDHHLVRDARETFRIEIQGDLDQMKPELATVDKANHATDAVTADLPQLAKDPNQLKRRVDALYTSGWIISSSSWAGALSSGALSHMSAKEVSRYSNFDLSVRDYSTLENRAFDEQGDLHAYVDSRHAFGPQEIEEVDNRLRKFAFLTKTMGDYGRQVVHDMQEANPK
jgi:hypothetical protein